MSTLLLAESGSTKTDWCLLKKADNPIYFRTKGINPYLQTPDHIQDLLRDELQWNAEQHPIDNIVFYGAGTGKKEKQTELANVLSQFFGTQNIEVYGDILAAARALCGHKKGVVCVLGTGSNAAYYDGKKIKQQHISLGFIAGDEGSGNHMGKRVLQYYAYETFDDELKESFEHLFGNNLHEMVARLYSNAFPNRQLAGYVSLLLANRGHYMVENIVEDCLHDFFHHHILKYRQSWKLPLYFTGSVAYEFRDVVQHLCNQYQLELGCVEQSPLHGLVHFHEQFL